MSWNKIASLMRKRPDQTWVGRQETEKANAALGVGRRHAAPLVLVIPGRSVALLRLRLALFLRSPRRPEVGGSILCLSYFHTESHGWGCGGLLLEHQHTSIPLTSFRYLWLWSFPVFSLCNKHWPSSCQQLCPVFRSTGCICQPKSPREGKKTNKQAMSTELLEQWQGLAWASIRTGTALLIRSSFYLSTVSQWCQKLWWGGLTRGNKGNDGGVAGDIFQTDNI